METREVTQTHRFVQEAHFRNLLSWSVDALLSENLRYKDSFQLKSIGSLLIRNRTKEVIEDDKMYKQVTVRLYGKGVVQRGATLASGKSIGTKNQYRVSEGQFIMSKIDARNGAFGIVPQELDGAITTQDFLSYTINTAEIAPQFFVLITSSEHFYALCQRASSGTTGRQRVNEKAFLNFKIPLPDKPEQQRLVNSYSTKIDASVEKKNQAEAFNDEIEQFIVQELGIQKMLPLKKKSSLLQIVSYKSITRWSLNFLLRNESFSLDEAKYSVVSLKHILLNFEGGKTPSKAIKDYWEDGVIPWISPKDFTGLTINKSQDKVTEVAIERSGMKVYPPGRLVGVFRSGILRHSFPIAITKISTSINQDLKILETSDKVNIYFLLYYLKAFQQLILERASKIGVTVESINSDEFLEFPIVLPPLEVQNRIASTVDSLLLSISTLKAEEQRLIFNAQLEFEAAIFNID